MQQNVMYHVSTMHEKSFFSPCGTAPWGGKEHNSDSATLHAGQGSGCILKPCVPCTVRSSTHWGSLPGAMLHAA